MNATTAWLIIQVMVSLIPKIVAMLEEEKSKQVGRDEIVKAVLKRFEDVEARAKAARDTAADNFDNGVRDNQFQRD